jgi:DNA-binding NarL/FixJ family response regulator
MPDTKNSDIVLVVDDSPGTLGFLTEALETAGMTVLVARDAAQAQSIVRRLMPDVILMDAVMPGVDGFEACRTIKQDKSAAHVPIIFMTGLSDTDHIVKGLEAGGVDYVTKPIKSDEIIARIRVHLTNARMTQRARVALDAAGRFLLSTSDDGRVLWMTPQAAQLLAGTVANEAAGVQSLPKPIIDWLHNCISSEPYRNTPLEMSMAAGKRLTFAYVSRVGSNDNLLRLVEGDANQDKAQLKTALGLTERESEVLLWIMRGKSNRDIGEILDLSPRTVNKHLEQIFAKLGVENRTAAAALASRSLGNR